MSSMRSAAETYFVEIDEIRGSIRKRFAKGTKGETFAERDPSHRAGRTSLEGVLLMVDDSSRRVELHSLKNEYGNRKSF